MIKHILVAYDGSESARHAVTVAVELARATGGGVRAVSVLEVSGAGSEACAVMMTDKGIEHTRDLRAELATLAPDATDIVDAEVVYGSPGDVLLAQVAEHAIDHIAIGHTERGALLRWLLGSVSGDIITRAPVPVTVVR